jgi:hypothetical protein
MNIAPVIFHIIISGINNYINYVNYIIFVNNINHMSSKKITRSGNLRTNTTSSGMSIDTIQQNVIFNQTDIETIKENISNLQSTNTLYNNRIVILENENDKLNK